MGWNGAEPAQPAGAPMARIRRNRDIRPTGFEPPRLAQNHRQPRIRNNGDDRTGGIAGFGRGPDGHSSRSAAPFFRSRNSKGGRIDLGFMEFQRLKTVRDSKNGLDLVRLDPDLVHFRGSSACRFSKVRRRDCEPTIRPVSPSDLALIEQILARQPVEALEEKKGRRARARFRRWRCHFRRPPRKAGRSARLPRRLPDPEAG
jgi:hypothetical protein